MIRTYAKGISWEDEEVGGTSSRYISSAEEVGHQDVSTWTPRNTSLNFKISFSNEDKELNMLDHIGL